MLSRAVQILNESLRQYDWQKELNQSDLANVKKYMRQLSRKPLRLFSESEMTRPQPINLAAVMYTNPLILASRSFGDRAPDSAPPSAA